MKRIAIYVIYDKDGILDSYREFFLKKLRPFVDTIVAVVSGTLSDDSLKILRTLVDDYFLRDNKGLLAGSWIDGIAHIGWNKLSHYDELLMLNDSFFGPFYPLDDFFEKMEKSDSDFYGVLKNFEEKSYKTIAGRPLKHGYFRGSICYFYVIKQKLLHSKAFKAYWTSKPVINEPWDTYFFAEMNFYDYVIDHGFKVDAYQSDKLKGYFFDNLSQNMELLVKNNKIPFARIRPFCTNMKDDSLTVGYGMDPRRTLEFIEKNTNYDVNMIWDYILRTKNLTDIYEQLQLEYVIPKNLVEKQFLYKNKIAVIIHIYYLDLVPTIVDYCNNFPQNTDFYVTTTTEETKQQIDKSFLEHQFHYTCQIRPNVGVAMSSLWITYANVIIKGNYDYICYFHDKKSNYFNYSMIGEQFANRCYENLFGSPEIVKNIINLFEDNKRMGVLGVPVVYHGDYFCVGNRSWEGNYINTVNLAKELNLHVVISRDIVPVAPYGDMFWFRASALKKVIEHGFTYEDFNIEYKPDFTLLHAIERIYGFAAQDSGYYYADVINSDFARTDLVNYQYIIYSACKQLLNNNQYPSSFQSFLNCMHGPYSSRSIVKKSIKKRIPSKFWLFLRKIYHLFGGKKWVG